MKLYQYYVVLQRFYFGDVVNIWDQKDAIAKNWVDDEGNRIWVVPRDKEYSQTFVWGFDDMDAAIEFYDAMASSEVGVPCGA